MAAGNDSTMTPGSRGKVKKSKAPEQTPNKQTAQKDNVGKRPDAASATKKGQKKRPGSLSPEKSEVVSGAHLKLSKSTSNNENRLSDGEGDVNQTGETSSARKRKLPVASSTSGAKAAKAAKPMITLEGRTMIRNRDRYGKRRSEDEDNESTMTEPDDDARVIPKTVKSSESKKKKKPIDKAADLGSVVTQKEGETSGAGNANTTGKSKPSGETTNKLSKSQKRRQRRLTKQNAEEAAEPVANNIPAEPAASTEPTVESHRMLTRAKKRKQNRKSSKSKDKAIEPAPVPTEVNVEATEPNATSSKSQKVSKKNLKRRKAVSSDDTEVPESIAEEWLAPREKVRMFSFKRAENGDKEGEDEEDSDSNGETRIKFEEVEISAEFNITKEKIKESIDALLKSLKQSPKKGQKSKLFEDSVKSIQLQVAVVRVPKGNAKFFQIILPHKPMVEDADVCLIIKDKERGLKKDHEENVNEFKSNLESAGVNVAEVLSLRQLKVEYKTFEAKRQLAKQYAAFLVDKRIFFRIPPFLGKFFYVTHKFPVSANLDKTASLKASVDKALRATLLSMSPKGSTLQMLVGNTSMSLTDIADNVTCAVEALNAKFIGGFRNIRSISIRTEGSIAVPIYISLETHDQVRRPVLESKITQETVVGDVSSLKPDEAIVVEPLGSLRVIPNPGFRPTPLDGEEFFQPESEEVEDEESEDEDEMPKKKQKKIKKGKEPKEKVNQGKEKKNVESVEVPKMRDIDESDSEVDMEEERYLSNLEHTEGEGQSEEEDLEQSESEGQSEEEELEQSESEGQSEEEELEQSESEGQSEEEELEQSESEGQSEEEELEQTESERRSEEEDTRKGNEKAKKDKLSKVAKGKVTESSKIPTAAANAQKRRRQ